MIENFLAIYYELHTIAIIIIAIVLTWFLSIYVAGDNKITWDVTYKSILIVILQLFGTKALLLFIPDSLFLAVASIAVTYFAIKIVFNPPLHRAILFTFLFTVFGKTIDLVLAGPLAEILQEFIY